MHPSPAVSALRPVLVLMRETLGLAAPASHHHYLHYTRANDPLPSQSDFKNFSHLRLLLKWPLGALQSTRKTHHQKLLPDSDFLNFNIMAGEMFPQYICVIDTLYTSVLFLINYNISAMIILIIINRLVTELDHVLKK